jgi:hypothetical protein
MTSSARPEVLVILSWLLLPSITLLLGLLARRGCPEVPSLQRALESRRAPWLVGLATSLFLTWLWGSLREPGFIHDEVAYLLQARIFATFRLAADPPPLPEFFEQYQVFVTPRLAPKYPPGHGLALVPGVWLGLPGLMPVVLHGAAAGLLFALARRLAGGGVAALTWVIWIIAPRLNSWRCTYLSQSTSTALWMLGAWLLLEWWEGGRTRHLVGVALVVGGLAVTRPWTALAYATPLAVVVLVGVWRRRAFRPLLLAVGAGSVVLALIPAWNQASLGDWRLLPYSRYSAVYFPYDKVSFDFDASPAQRALSPDMQRFDADMRKIFRDHTTNLPRQLVDRLVFAGSELWGAPGRGALPLFLLIGLFGLDPRGRFAMAWVLSPFAWYAAFGHPPNWAVYYHEAHTILAFVVALGLCRSLSFLATGSLRSTEGAAGHLLPVVALGLLGVAAGLWSAATLRPEIQSRTAYHRRFHELLASIPDPPAIVFVRYGPHHNPHRSLIENPPDHRQAPVWVVRDRGEDDRRLLDLFPERAGYLFDDDSWTLYRLVPTPPR